MALVLRVLPGVLLGRAISTGSVAVVQADVTSGRVKATVLVRLSLADGGLGAARWVCG